ncbi:Protein ASP-1 protein3 [Aphelenchoides avenae]|nr:Protein ASP-1 protein3 [Aphelenchus avenae]
MTAYRHGLIDEPIWTLWLTKSSQTAGHPAGRITYGAVDATNCGSNVDYFDVEPYQEYDFLLPLFSVSLGNYTADATSSLLFAADLDISSTYALEAGPSFIRPLANAAGAKRNADGTYTLPCDADVKPLVLEFARLLHLTYNIGKKELVLQTGSDSCKLNLKEVPILDGTTPRLFVVGSPLAREYCTVHDIAKRQFGLAKKIVY